MRSSNKPEIMEAGISVQYPNSDSTEFDLIVPSWPVRELERRELAAREVVHNTGRDAVGERAFEDVVRSVVVDVEVAVRGILERDDESVLHRGVQRTVVKGINTCRWSPSIG
jgi:hypothetical protein